MISTTNFEIIEINEAGWAELMTTERGWGDDEKELRRGWGVQNKKLIWKNYFQKIVINLGRRVYKWEK